MSNFAIDVRNTRMAATTNGKIAVVVICPYCTKAHYHPPGTLNHSVLRAKCNAGYYQIKFTK